MVLDFVNQIKIFLTRVKRFTKRKFYQFINRFKISRVNLGSKSYIQDAIHELPKTLPNGIVWPKISVITPSYNQGKYIAETIESIIKQGYPNVEHIIIDGGSTDETCDVVSRYSNHVARFISEPDKGQSDALNKGFNLATGDIFCWLNSDDQFAPGALAAVAMAFVIHKPDMVTGICEIYSEGKLVDRHMTSCVNGKLPLDDILDLDNGWNAGQFFYQPEVFFSRDLWHRSGGHVREDCYYSMDYELWCRFAYAGAELHVIGTPLAWFRMHPEQKTADPAKFKRELIKVRDQFVSEFSVKLKPSNRPDVRLSRNMRVAMVNDIGVKHGAGIAHGRIASSIEMAGHNVKLFDLNSTKYTNGKPNEEKLIKDVIKFNPDIVVFGNLHAATRDSIETLKSLSVKYPILWVTHDFWLFTGRCAYTGDCEKYLTKCDERCPTATDYPDLSPIKIEASFKNKYTFIKDSKNLYFLANSLWSGEVVKKYLENLDGQLVNNVAQIKLGASSYTFRPVTRDIARNVLGLKQDAFVVAFSVSSLSEQRKGGSYLLEALQDVGLNNLTILLIGNQDVPFAAEGAEVVSLGYITDPETLNVALSAADIFVGPSTEETFGQVFIEAALAGTPSIGFNIAGVKDSIIEGVTGLRVTLSSKALQDAIIRMYNDRDLCQSMARWSRIYALNEFTLEASYHSLFSFLRSKGFVDKFGIANKIGFRTNFRVGNEPIVSIRSWQVVDGISIIEGPYPQLNLNTTFRWCYGPHSKLTINTPCAGSYKIKLFYLNLLFKKMEVRFDFNQKRIETLALKQTKSGETAVIEFEVYSHGGANFLDIYPEIFSKTSSLESRPLSFAIQDINIQLND